MLSCTVIGFIVNITVTVFRFLFFLHFSGGRHVPAARVDGCSRLRRWRAVRRAARSETARVVTMLEAVKHSQVAPYDVPFGANFLCPGYTSCIQLYDIEQKYKIIALLQYCSSVTVYRLFSFKCRLLKSKQSGEQWRNNGENNGGFSRQ